MIGLIMKKRRQKKRRSGNPVAKNLNKFNKPATHVDRKKREKDGYEKHKSEIADG